jgi:hypothetical protein
MNLKTIYIKLFFKRLFVVVLFLAVVIQPLSKVISSIIGSNYELVLLDWEDSSEEEQQQEDDTKNEKTQILFTYTPYNFCAANNTKLINASENISENILREVHSPPPDHV